jgi:signal transduction histidine kinase
VEFDFDLMEHVLINLIENAFRHGKPPVYVSAEAHPDELWIKVEDYGIGEVITLDTPSGELLSKTTSGSGGLGLGLAVCKGLVEVHRGRIWNERITTPTGDRTTFIVSIPMSVYQD